MPPGDEDMGMGMGVRGVIRHVVDTWVKAKAEERELYEKRTQVFERIAMALEHDNEQKWHAVR